MRLKNVKGAKERINKSKYIIIEPINLDLQKLFGNNNDVQLEIGTGKGDFLIEMARRNPNINFLGIEKYDSVLVRAIEKIDELELSNIYFIREDAMEIDKILNKNISKIYLNFSDPWPKERHAKRRLTSPVFLKKYDHVFKMGKEIQMKTDNRKLFEYSLMSLVDYGYKIKELSLNLYEDDHEDNVATEYETKFVKMGKIIYRALFSCD